MYDSPRVQVPTDPYVTKSAGSTRSMRFTSRPVSLGVKNGMKPTPVPAFEGSLSPDFDERRLRNESSPLLTIGAPKPIDYDGCVAK